MQTQTSNTLHNAIMEAGSKDRPLMLAPGIDNDIYSTVDACPNACEMWKAIERLKQGNKAYLADYQEFKGGSVAFGGSNGRITGQIFLEELEKLKRQEKEANDAAESLRKEATHDIQNANTSSTNLLNIVSTPLSTAGPSRAFNDGELLYPNDPSMPHLEDIYASPSEGMFY
nr:hypothetical protein [Tanacetum cinerariifolium]